MAFHDSQFANRAMDVWREEAQRAEHASRGLAQRRLSRRMAGYDPVEWTGEDPGLVAAQEAYRAAHARWVAEMDGV